MNKLEEYGNLFSKLGLTEMSVKDGDFEVVLKKEVPVAKVETVPVPVSTANVVSADNQKPIVTVQDTTDNNVTEICAPVVGVFYAGENPDADPFVKVGDTVKKGDVVCIIEAMKMFNDVVADKDGIVKEVCVSNGQLVEFKQTLIKLENI